MRQPTTEELKNLNFFQGLPEALLQELLLLGKEVCLPPRTAVFSAGPSLNQVYVLLEGKVMIYNLTKHGHRKILFLLGRGQLLNHSLLDESKSSVFCESMTAVRLLAFPRLPFLELMEGRPALSRAVLRSYERFLWRLCHQLKNTTGRMQVERKVAAKLWKLARDFGVPCPQGIRIEAGLSVTLLADLVGAPRETISRACRSLSQRGLLLIQGRRFILPDPEGLSQFYRM